MSSLVEEAIKIFLKSSFNRTPTVCNKALEHQHHCKTNQPTTILIILNLMASQSK